MLSGTLQQPHTAAVVSEPVRGTVEHKNSVGGNVSSYLQLADSCTQTRRKSKKQHELQKQFGLIHVAAEDSFLPSYKK